MSNQLKINSSNNGLLPGNKILLGDVAVKFDKQFMATYMGVPNISDQNMAKILTKAYAEGLNPLTDIHVVAFGGKCDLMEKVENKLKRAMATGLFKGINQGIYVVNSENVLEKRDNEIYLKGIDKQLVGAWCEVEHVNFGTIKKDVNFNEFDKKQSTWNTMPASMIVKVARGQALDLAFPNLFNGIYTQEEVSGHPEATEYVTAEYTDKPEDIQAPILNRPVEESKAINDLISAEQEDEEL